METQFNDLSVPNPGVTYYCMSKIRITTATNFTHLMKLVLYKSINVSDANIKKFYNIRLMIIDIVQKNPDEINRRNDVGLTALMIACGNVTEFSSIKCVKLLIKLKANVNLQDNHGWSALHMASINLSTEIIKLLIKCEADINLQNNSRNTALTLMCDVHATTPSRTLECIRAMLNADADVNIQNDYEKNALMIFCEECACGDPIDSLKCIELLINSDIDINAQDHAGRTALIHYCRSRIYASCPKTHNLECIMLLINSGADVNLEDAYGDNALMHYCATCQFNEESLDIMLLLIRSTYDIMKTHHGKSAHHYFINNYSRALINCDYVESLLLGKSGLTDIKSARKVL